MNPATSAHDRRWLTLGVLCLSLFVIVMDNTIVNVALPTLVRDLGTSISQLQWVVDSYTLVFAGLLLTAGSLGDRFGRRGALNVGLVIFGGASTVAAFAGGVNALVAARAVMGVGAALIMPATLSILTNVFTDARERAIAIALWSAVAGVAVALGPVSGGFLLEHFWWGSVFIINAPVVVVALVAGRMLVPTSRDPAAPRIDWGGAALSIVGLTALVWAIIEAPERGWTSSAVVAGFALAIVVLAAFARWELRRDEPMLDLRFFTNPRFTAASAAITLIAFALFGFIFMATQYLQFILGYSALSAGVHTLPFAGAVILTAPLSSKLVERYGTKLVVTFGLLSFAAGLLTAAGTSLDSTYSRVFVAMVLMGGGMGLASAPATESIMGSLPKAKAGVGSAVNDTTRELGGAFGVAIVGSVLSSLYAARLGDRLDGTVPTPSLDAAKQSMGAALAVGHQVGGSDGARIIGAARDAFVHAMTRASLITAVFALAGAAVALRWLPARATNAEVNAIELDDITAVETLEPAA
ncbi:MAG: DHA2 family efflux MFS transporter permease subunit [Actinobacteria bacterium]|nr:MAG: DHA2 family efflux MFS transporter permease subunit [Actinomycetota bacterium]